MNRAQLTIPDVVEIAAGLAILAGLSPVLYKFINSSDAGTGTSLLIQMVVPGLVVTVLVIMFAIAVGGAS